MAQPLATFDFRVQDPQQRSKGGKFDRPYWVYHIRCRTSAEAYQRKELEPVRRWCRCDGCGCSPVVVKWKPLRHGV